jgi:hypothetical protein
VDAADLLGGTTGPSSDEGPEDEGWRTDGKPALTRANREPPWGIEPRTYALRASPVHDGGRRFVWFDAGLCTDSPGQVTVDDGARRLTDSVA